MLTEEEIRRMLEAVVEQAKHCGGGENPQAYKILAQRAHTLAWVLQHPKALPTLTLTEEQLKVLETFY